MSQPLRAELAEQLDVLIGDGRGLRRVRGGLTQVIQADEQARRPQRPGHPDRVLLGFTRHIVLDDGPRARRGRDELAQPRTA
jgi:hypothetical protein